MAPTRLRVRQLSINLLALNNEGALFLLIYSLLLLAFTAMVWFVLYKIPDRLGLISKR